jgi:hypothetical protein
MISRLKQEMFALLFDVDKWGQDAVGSYTDKVFPIDYSWPDGVRLMSRQEFAELWNTNALYVPSDWVTWVCIEYEAGEMHRSDVEESAISVSQSIREYIVQGGANLSNETIDSIVTQVYASVRDDLLVRVGFATLAEVRKRPRS